MAKKKTKKKNKKGNSKKATSTHRADPKYPYTTSPKALRKFLKEVPNRPRPTKVNNDLLTAWELGGSNANSIIRVLKAVELIDSANQPTASYDSFMQPEIGPAVLGGAVKDLYAKMFEASHEPYKDDGELRRLFNIHSGGSDATLNYQVQTLKALCEFATFDGLPTSSAGAPKVEPAPGGGLSTAVNGSGPTIHIDLHIHLPENKTTRDYEAIIQDIARYIYRQEDLDNE